jgi:ribosomal-protein-alanine N-acetyltransferase
MDAMGAKVTRFQDFSDYRDQNRTISCQSWFRQNNINLLMHIIAQTPRFVIRNFRPEEEDIYMALFDDQRVTLHLPNRSRKEHIKIFKETLNDYTQHKVLGRWGMFNTIDGEFIGLCLLRNFDDEDGKVELGYVLHQKYWGRGIASEMAILMISYGFTHANALEIVAVTTLENTSSQKVLEKAGLMRMDNYKRNREELAYFRIIRGSL